MSTSFKTCSVCSQELSVDEFYRDRTRSDGLHRMCRKCDADRYRQRWAAGGGRRKTPPQRRTPGETRRHNLWNKYRLTPESWESILEAQGGSCAVCRRSSDCFHVDHDHSCCPGGTTCGSCVRGILCGNCNRMLGLAGDSVETLRQAAAYLEARS